MRFLGSDSDIELDAHHPEFDAWQWATREEVLRDIVAFKRPLYQAALKEFAALFSATQPLRAPAARRAFSSPTKRDRSRRG